MKIGFFVNDVIPGMGLPCSGQGLRAWGFISGLRNMGIDAYAIIRHSTLTHRMQRWKGFATVRFPEHVVLTNNARISETLSGFDYVVFHNWAAGHGITKPADSNVKFIYDFFSATLVEHSFISDDEAYLQGVMRKKLSLIRQSDFFLGNGVGRVAYAQDFLNDLKIEATVHDFPTCLPWMGLDGDKGNVLLGGYEQEWARSLPVDFINILADARPNLQFNKVGGNQHYYFGRKDNGTMDASGNVTIHDVVSFQDYVRLNARCGAFVDVAPLNDERRLSFSTRGALSIACGCPLIHNAETDLGQMISEFGAGAAITEEAGIANTDVLLEAIDTCITPEAAAGCRALWEAHFDCDKAAARLVEIIGHD